MDHQSQNVESAITAILNQLTDDQIAWAADPARGVFRGYLPCTTSSMPAAAASQRQPRQR